MTFKKVIGIISAVFIALIIGFLVGYFIGRSQMKTKYEGSRKSYTPQYIRVLELRPEK